MRVTLFLAAFVFAISVTLSANAQKKNELVVHFKSNMHCADCEKSLFEHLRFEKGVKDLALDHVSNTIKIVYQDNKTGEEALKNSVVKKGYSAEKIGEEEYKNLKLKTQDPKNTTGTHKH
jgi:periplasmic mercuric ion binding protein